MMIRNASSSAELPGPAEATPGEASLSRSPGSTSASGQRRPRSEASPPAGGTDEPKRTGGVSPVEGYGEGLSAGAGGSPEEVVSETNDPASSGHRFPLRPDVCKHKNNRGQDAFTVHVEGKDVCGLCGTPLLYIKETA